MFHHIKTAFVTACVSIVAPVSGVLAFAAQPNDVVDEGGVCTDLGCVGGPEKCADGVLTLPSGGSATYTCYTKKAAEE